MFTSLLQYLEYLGGARDDVDARRARVLDSPVLLGLWWALLLAVVLCFCGQSSKFIYIDF